MDLSGLQVFKPCEVAGLSTFRSVQLGAAEDSLVDVGKGLYNQSSSWAFAKNTSRALVGNVILKKLMSRSEARIASGLRLGRGIRTHGTAELQRERKFASTRRLRNRR